jgi:hypothetical protein
MTQSNTDFDNPWKSVIEVYFRDFMRFFFPQIEPEIDWSRGFTFLDKELQKVVRDAEIGKRYADKLVQVWKTNGELTLVLCHIEVQSQHETDFPKRMLSYNYRLRERYNCPVVSLAILADESKKWRPSSYQASLWGCALTFEFPIVKLLDYQTNGFDLEANHNPFAIVTLAHLKTRETHTNPQARKDWKFRLTTMLYDRGYGEQDILELYNFLDWLMNLPEELAQQFETEIDQFEETRRMKYVSTRERRAIAQTKEEIALNLLQSNVPLETIATATKLTITQIQELQARQEQPEQE